MSLPVQFEEPAIGPRRLTLVAPSLRAGGAERVLSTLANAWAERGVVVTLLTVSGAADDFYTLHPAVRRISLDLSFDSRGVMQALAGTSARVRGIRREIRRSRPDAVLSFVDTTNVLTLLATRGLGLPVVVSERTDPSQHRVGRVWEAARRALYPFADALVVQSHEVARWADRVADVDRVHVIANPLTPTFGLANEAPSEARGSPHVVGMGRLSPEKGFDLLIRAMPRLLDGHPAATLTIFGEGAERAALERLVSDLGVGDRVDLPGQVSDPAPHLRRGDVFVLPSRYEGFPNALVEAMACGLAVVAADCPSGPRQIVRHGVDGLLVSPEDPDAIAEAIDTLLSDADARARLGDAAREVSERFGLERIMGEWNRLIASLRRPLVRRFEAAPDQADTRVPTTSARR